MGILRRYINLVFSGLLLGVMRHFQWKVVSFGKTRCAWTAKTDENGRDTVCLDIWHSIFNLIVLGKMYSFLRGRRIALDESFPFH